MVRSAYSNEFAGSASTWVSDASSSTSASSASILHAAQSSRGCRRSLKLLGICARCRKVIWLPSQCDGTDETTHDCDPLASPYIGRLLSLREEELEIHNQNLAYLILEANHYIMTTYATRPHVLERLPKLASIDRLYWSGDIPGVLLPFVECPRDNDIEPVLSPFISICPSCCQVVWYGACGDANHHWGVCRNESFDEKHRRISMHTRGYLSLRTVSLLEKENLALRNMDWRDATKDGDGGTIQCGADESAAPLCKYREGSHWSRRKDYGEDNDGESMRKRQMADLHEFFLLRFGTSPHTKINVPVRARPRQGGEDGEDEDDYEGAGADGVPTVPVKPIYSLTPYQMRHGWPFSDRFRSELKRIQRILISFFRYTMPPRQPPVPGNAISMPYLVFPDIVAYESQPSAPPLPLSSRPKAPAVAVPVVKETESGVNDFEAAATDSAFVKSSMDGGEAHDLLPPLASWAPLDQPFWGANPYPMQQPFGIKQQPVQLPQMGQLSNPLHRLPNPYMQCSLYPIPPPQAHPPVYPTPYPLGISIDENCPCGNIRGSLACAAYRM